MRDPALAAIIGESPVMQALRAVIEQAAPLPLPVLIQGPTGACKELVARALHAASGRTGRFVPFNVCAIADTMFEDDLFGHVPGASPAAPHHLPPTGTRAPQSLPHPRPIRGLAPR